MRTRRATPHDAFAIRTLIDRYVPDGTLLPRTASYIAAHADHYLVAEDEGHVIGCVHLEEYSPSIAELRSLAVDPAHHGRGIGRALVLATEALAQRRGYATLFAVSNDEEFFARFGFSSRHIPELDRERSEVSRYKGVFAKDVGLV
jgi:amino-acid N-acetyltransferase